MQKSKTYYNMSFPGSVVKEAYDLFLSKLAPKEDISYSNNEFRIENDSETWCFDSSAEFFAQYSTADRVRLDCMAQGNRITVDRTIYSTATWVTVSFPTRCDIEAIFEVFERNLDVGKVVVESDPIKIFIGHGRDPQWRDVKDHLHDHHGLDVVAYEIGPRAGLSVKEVLEDMLSDSSFALLVLTGEDQHADGEFHARENVIHELGLFQGQLGFTRAVAILEDGVNEFSNILGVNQIRFSKGNIRETFGDILATIKREFEGRED